MVLRSMHECMHAARFCSGFFFFWNFQSTQNFSWGFAAIEIVFTLFYFATSGAVQSTVGFVKSRKEIPVVHEGLACHFALHIVTHATQYNNRSGFNSSMQLTRSVLSLQVSVAMPYYSIVMVSIGSSSGLSPSVSSGECAWQCHTTVLLLFQ